MLLDTQQPMIQITSSAVPTKELRKKPKRKHGLKSSTKVRFSQDVQAREIPHLNDVSEQQIECTWYTEEEYSDIKSEILLTLKRQRYGVLDNCKELCFRGLEARTREGSIFRRSNRRNSLEAVLHEQSRQESLRGLHSSDDIAQVYMDTTFENCRAAHAKGLSDARKPSEGSKKEEMQEVKMDKSSVQKSKIDEVMMSLNADLRVVSRSKSSRFKVPNEKRWAI